MHETLTYIHLVNIIDSNSKIENHLDFIIRKPFEI